LKKVDKNRKQAYIPPKQLQPANDTGMSFSKLLARAMEPISLQDNIKIKVTNCFLNYGRFSPNFAETLHLVHLAVPMGDCHSNQGFFNLFDSSTSEILSTIILLKNLRNNL